MIEIALVAQVVLWIIVVGVFACSRQASIFHPLTVYLAFHGLVFVLRPILVYRFGFDASFRYMQFSPSDPIFVRTLAVSSVAMVSFVIVCMMAGRCRTDFATSQPPVFTDLDYRALMVTTLLLLPAMAYSIYATRNGIAGERVNGVYIMTNSTGYLNEAQDFIMPLMCAWILLTRFHWLNLFPSVFYVGYRTWFGWSRWTILLFFLLLVLSYCWYYRKKWIPFWSVVVVIPILLLFNIIGHNRDVFKMYLAGEDVRVGQFGAGMTDEDKIKAQFDTQDFANFDYLTYVVYAVPGRTETYSFGLQYLQLFTEPIPRILWRGKPVGAPVKTINPFAYGNFTGLTVSLAGDGWISGGWIGVVITLSIVGFLLGRAHRWFWTNMGDSTGCILYLVTLAMVPQWYRDGGISIAKFLLFNVTPIVFWIGMKWLLGNRFVPLYSVAITADSRLRMIQNETAPPMVAPELR